MADLGEEVVVADMDLGNDLIPDGQYIAQVTEESIGDTKSGGRMVTLKWEILDGEQEGRLFWTRYNWRNPNADAERIGRRELGRCAVAMGIERFTNTEQFLFKPIRVDLIVKKGNNGYQDSNEIKSNGYHPINGDAPPAATNDAPRNDPPRATSAQTQAGQQQAAKSGGRPWDRARA